MNTFRWNLKPGDVAWHPDESEGSYEWWYLDGQFQQGYQFVGEFFPRPAYPFSQYRGVKEEANLPSVGFHISTPDNVAHELSKVYPVSEFHASTQTCDVTIGPNKLTGKFKESGLPEEFHVKMSAADTAVDLTYRVQVAGMKFTDREDGHTSYDPVTKKYFGWWVVAPRSKIEGTITVNGKSARVSGLGYQDHNVGTIKWPDLQSRWLWGRIYAGDYTIVYSDSTSAARHGYRHFTPFVLWKGAKVILSTYNFACYPEKFDIDPVTKCPYPRTQTFRASDGCIEVRAQILPGVLIRKTKSIDVPGFPFTVTDPGVYLRQFSEVDLQIRWGEQGEIEKVKGQSIHEFCWMENWFPIGKE